MKKVLITFLILTTSIGFSQDSEWTYLFDGETLNGWHVCHKSAPEKVA